MAKTNRNFLTFNYAGKVGKQYSLRNRGDQSIIASLPKKSRKSSSDQELTQQNVKDNFQRAVRKGTQSAFNVAFLDAYKGPRLKDLRTDEYEGVAGNPITVEALDNFRVKSVKFTLFSPDGTKLEEGEGKQAVSSFQWVYTTQVANPSVTGTKLKITAKDIPDNMTVLEVVL